MTVLAKYGAVLLLVTTGVAAEEFPFPNSINLSVNDRVQRMFYQAELDHAHREAEKLQVQRAYQEQLHRRMTEFAEAWNSLAAELTERGTFNIRQCERITKAFQRLQKTRGWPRPEKK
jgi:hypothetical protein